MKLVLHYHLLLVNELLNYFLVHLEIYLSRLLYLQDHLDLELKYQFQHYQIVIYF